MDLLSWSLFSLDLFRPVRGTFPPLLGPLLGRVLLLPVGTIVISPYSNTPSYEMV